MIDLDTPTLLFSAGLPSSKLVYKYSTKDDGVAEKEEEEEMKLFSNFKHFMRHAGFAQTTYSNKQTDKQVPFGPLSLAFFYMYSEEKVYFSFTAKVHV